MTARQLTLDEALYGGLPPHVRWSDTSAGAALSMVGKTRRIRRRVLWYVAGRLEGATCDEVEVDLGLRHQTASARVRELVQLDCLFDTSTRRRTRSGRWARVYRLTPHARRAWREAVTADDDEEAAEEGGLAMTIRYELDTSGPLHKIIKVVDATPPVLEPPDPTVRPLTPAQAAGYLSTVAAGLRADTRRKRRWGFNGVAAPNTPDPARDLPGEDLLRARKAAGLSQRELAAQWGLSRGLIGTIELGHRSCPLELADWARRVNADTAQAEQEAQAEA